MARVLLLTLVNHEGAPTGSDWLAVSGGGLRWGANVAAGRVREWAMGGGRGPLCALRAALIVHGLGVVCHEEGNVSREKLL